MWFNILIKITCVLVLIGLCNGHEDSDSKMHPTLSDEVTRKNLKINTEELDSEFWIKNAHKIINEKIKIKLNKGKAKNIIFFLGDGMSLHTVAASRIMVGGEENLLSFEKFPSFGLSKTYCVDSQVADSACTATAYLNGVKGNIATIGVNGKVPYKHCEAELDVSTHTESIAKWAQKACKATGIVTTTRVTHASPAGTYAHTANRDWENDFEIEKDKCNRLKLKDIAYQLVYGDVGKNFKVILGGGRREFLGEKMIDEENEKGRRLDGKNLINEWKLERSKLGQASYIWNNKELKSIDINKTDYLLGLFESSHCHYTADIEKYHLEENEPTLSEMIKVAIQILQKEPKGYFLFVEGGRIDMGHHDNKARKALTETEEFSKTIKLARDMTKEDDTLIVITSDHAHTMSFNGYPVRGNDILEFAGQTTSDKVPYLTLSYANGPGFFNTYNNETGKLIDLRTLDTDDLDFEFTATVPLISETHGGDDVGVYASGPWEHLFTGTYEQNNIPLMMAYAAKIGVYSDNTEECEPSHAAQLEFKTTIITIFILFLQFIWV